MANFFEPTPALKNGATLAKEAKLKEPLPNTFEELTEAEQKRLRAIAGRDGSTPEAVFTAIKAQLERERAQPDLEAVANAARAQR